MQISFVKDALYNCHPQAGSNKSYASGVLVGLVSGFMAHNKSFEETLSILKTLVRDGIFDLTEQNVIEYLPDCWVGPWNQAEYKFE